MRPTRKAAVGPTVPGQPSWAATPPESGGDSFTAVFLLPPNDGGAEITEFRIYVDGVLFGTNSTTLPLVVDVTLNYTGTFEIAVTVVNSVGESPRLIATYAYE